MKSRRDAHQAFLSQIQHELAALPATSTTERAAVYLKQAVISLGYGEWDAVAGGLAQLAAIAQSEGQTLPQAQALYAQGLARKTLNQIEHPEASEPDAADLDLSKAADLFQQVGQPDRAEHIRTDSRSSPPDVIQKLQALATHPDRYQDFLTDAAGLSETLEELQAFLAAMGDSIQTLIETPAIATEQPELLAELYALKAQWHEAMNRPAEAETDWQQARDTAQQHDRSNRLTDLQTQAEPGGSFFELPKLDALSLAETAFSNGYQPLQDDQLAQTIQAFQRADWATTLDHAIALRKESLQSPEVDRYALYLMACLLMALAYEKQGNDVAALTSLLMCKATLEKSRVSKLGQQINQFVAGLPNRWGRDRYEAARLTFRETFSQRQETQ